jgi:hypothetical protein
VGSHCTADAPQLPAFDDCLMVPMEENRGNHPGLLHHRARCPEGGQPTSSAMSS